MSGGRTTWPRAPRACESSVGSGDTRVPPAGGGLPAGPADRAGPSGWCAPRPLGGGSGLGLACIPGDGRLSTRPFRCALPSVLPAGRLPACPPFSGLPALDGRASNTACLRGCDVVTSSDDIDSLCFPLKASLFHLLHLDSRSPWTWCLRVVWRRGQRTRAANPAPRWPQRVGPSSRVHTSELSSWILCPLGLCPSVSRQRPVLQMQIWS